LPKRDQYWLKSFISRICDQIEEYYGRAPNYIEVQGLIQRFVKNNSSKTIPKLIHPTSIGLATTIRGSNTRRYFSDSRRLTLDTGGRGKRSREAV